MSTINDEFTQQTDPGNLTNSSHEFLTVQQGIATNNPAAHERTPFDVVWRKLLTIFAQIAGNFSVHRNDGNTFDISFDTNAGEIIGLSLKQGGVTKCDIRIPANGNTVQIGNGTTDYLVLNLNTGNVAIKITESTPANTDVPAGFGILYRNGNDLRIKTKSEASSNQTGSLTTLS